MSISRGADSETGEHFYALHCISENNISKLQSIYTAEQLEVLKAALEIIITKNGRFKAKKVVKIMLNKNIKFPVIKDIFLTIEEFVKEKYFQKIDEYYYILPRALIEFNNYFRTYYKDFIQDCVLCNTIAIRPQTCKHCSVPFHKACAVRFSTEHDLCINCNNPLDLNQSVESNRSEDTSQQVKTQHIADWLNGVNSDNESDNESLEEAMEVVESQQNGSRRPNTQSSSD